MPLTSERYLRDFTPRQRLKIYEHVTRVARDTKQQHELSAEQYSFLTEDLIKKQVKGSASR